jgi:hypothetical protein
VKWRQVPEEWCAKMCWVRDDGYDVKQPMLPLINFDNICNCRKFFPFGLSSILTNYTATHRKALCEVNHAAYFCY